LAIGILYVKGTIGDYETTCIREHGHGDRETIEGKQRAFKSTTARQCPWMSFCISCDSGACIKTINIAIILKNHENENAVSK